MNECSVCGKEIPEPATECGVRCLQEASQKGVAVALKARSSFAQAFQKMLTADSGQLPKLPEVSMIFVKHRWMKNRNLVQGSVVLSFDDKGIAKVPDQGNNRRTVDLVVANSRGLMSVVELTSGGVVKTPPPPKPAAPPSPPPKPVVVAPPKPIASPPKPVEQKKPPKVEVELEENKVEVKLEEKKDVDVITSASDEVVLEAAVPKKKPPKRKKPTTKKTSVKKKSSSGEK